MRWIRSWKQIWRLKCPRSLRAKLPSNIVAAAISAVAVGFTADIASGCNRTTYDRAMPRMVKDTVDEHGNRFEWASDAEPNPNPNSPFRIWNYVYNQPDPQRYSPIDAQVNGHPLAVKWEKAGIVLSALRPLPAGFSSCYSAPADNVGVDDAPLYYDLANHRQAAKAYVEKPLGLKERLMRFMTTFLLNVPVCRMSISR